MKPTTYRKDGWPLCPCCGEDELAVRGVPAGFGLGMTRAAMLAWYLEQELYCYVCGRVTVEAGEATA